jgi:hypothetical protein
MKKTNHISTYTISGLRKLLYPSSKAWGVSQWKRVTKGFKPENYSKDQNEFACPHGIINLDDGNNYYKIES